MQSCKSFGTFLRCLDCKVRDFPLNLQSFHLLQMLQKKGTGMKNNVIIMIRSVLITVSMTACGGVKEADGSNAGSLGDTGSEVAVILRRNKK